MEPGTAVVVDNRQVAAIPFLLRNLLENLPANWSIQFIHSAANIEWLRTEIAKLDAAAARIQLRELPEEKFRLEEYNRLLKSREFYEGIPTELFLIVQLDGMICAPHKDLLNKFTKYDYVGAPWSHRKGIGNGGFSLRRKSKILTFIDTCPPNDDAPEDGYFADGCKGVRLAVPSDEVAREFSIESVYAPRSFGVHNAWYFHPDKLEALEAQCPGIRELQRLNREAKAKKDW
jgi:hypothetical protein